MKKRSWIYLPCARIIKELFCILNSSLLKGKEDVTGAKILKVFECLKQKLAPFTVLASGWDWDKKQDAVLYFVLKKKNCPNMESRSLRRSR